LQEKRQIARFVAKKEKDRLQIGLIRFPKKGVERESDSPTRLRAGRAKKPRHSLTEVAAEPLRAEEELLSIIFFEGGKKKMTACPASCRTSGTSSPLRKEGCGNRVKFFSPKAWKGGKRGGFPVPKKREKTQPRKHSCSANKERKTNHFPFTEKKRGDPSSSIEQKKSKGDSDSSRSTHRHKWERKRRK